MGGKNQQRSVTPPLPASHPSHLPLLRPPVLTGLIGNPGPHTRGAMGRSRRSSMARIRLAYLGFVIAACCALASSNNSVGGSSTNSSTTITTAPPTGSTSPASDIYCAAADDEHDNFTLVGSVTDPVSIVRLRLDGCSSSSAAAGQFLRLNRFAVTIEPSGSDNESFIATVPPNLIKPVYERTVTYDSTTVGVLSFRLKNSNVSAVASASASTLPPRAGIRIRIPPNQLRAVIVDAGSPFYVYIRDGFTRVSSIHIEAGYGLNPPSTSDGGNIIRNLGAQLVADLQSNTVPLTLGLDGNGAKVKVRSGSTIEALQVSTLGSDIAIQGDVECDPSNLPCYILGGDAGGLKERSTVMLLEGLVRGPIAASATLSTYAVDRTGTNASNQTAASLQIMINNPYYVGNPCNVLRRSSSGVGSSGLSCIPTNETVDFSAWFPCTTPLDSEFGRMECARTDASTMSDVCTCSVTTANSPGASPIVRTSSGFRRGDGALAWLSGLSVLVVALPLALY